MYEELKITVVALNAEDIVCASNGEGWKDPNADGEGGWD